MRQGWQRIGNHTLRDEGNSEMAKEEIHTIKKHLVPSRAVSTKTLVLILCTFFAISIFQIDAASQTFSDRFKPQNSTERATEGSNTSELDRSIEKRIEKIEQTLESIRVTGEKAEDRSYFNKLMSMELIRYVRIMVIVLIVIAILFPLTLWLLSRKRLIALSGLSDEVTATLLLVEERQAKLANLLREIQTEIDYMDNMSAPDLKKLIEQAEKYLKQNEKDLRETGARVQKGTAD